MEYNTTRGNLIISEYGRNVQDMVQYICSLEDREKRNRMANTLVNVLANMHPEMREQGDLKHKLWDHLHVMAEFKLDVDSPYPIPPSPQEAPGPQRVRYTQEEIKLRPYGKYMQRIIEKATLFEEGAEKEALVKTIANGLKKMYLNWNRDSVNDELIHEHLDLLSAGRLKLGEDDRLHSTVDILKANKQVPQQSTQPQQQQHRRKFIPKKDNNNGRHRRKY
ncbi:MAG: DUF4290 domain-containing protein [Bacteroidales bacterium]|nr:DUF4290 domain-containing protein [Bacteroidales bacterium]